MGRTRYFVLRSINLQNVEKSVEEGVWATQPHNEEKLNEAYATSDDVVLIFSVNGSGHFQGYARMASPVKQEQAAIWEGDANVGGAFRVEWLQRVDLPHGETDHLRNPWNEGKPVRICRDGTEVEPAVGAELVVLIDQMAERTGAARPGKPLRPPPGAGAGMVGRGVPAVAAGALPRSSDFDGPGFGFMGDMGPEFGMMGMNPMLAMGMMGGFGMMPFGGMMGGMPGLKGMMMEEAGFPREPFIERPPPPPPPRDGPGGFDRAPGGFGRPRRGGFPEGPGPGRFDGPPDRHFDPRFDGPPPQRRGGGDFDGPPPRGGPFRGPPDWDRGRPPSPMFHERYRSRSPEFWGPLHGGGRGGGPPPGYGRGQPQHEYGPPRRDERPSILDMTYEEYVARFERVHQLRRGADGAAAGSQQAGPATAGGGAAMVPPPGNAGPAPSGGGGVHLMSEEQYLAYCERYMQKMGIPFDPGMVSQHYRRMREAAGV